MLKNFKQAIVLSLVLILSLFSLSCKKKDENSGKTSQRDLRAAENQNASSANINTEITIPQNEIKNELKLPILMYHHLGPLPPNPDKYRLDLTLPGNMLEEQLKFLRDSGYQSINLQAVADYFEIGKPLPEKAVALTFDDGYVDNFEYALPILKKYNFKATFFIISGFVGTSGYMNFDQLREISSNGMEIASHGVGHLDLTTLSPTKLNSELQNSKEVLEKNLNISVVSFCYPSGKYNANVATKVKALGYKLARTTDPGTIVYKDKLFELSTTRIHNTTTAEGLKNLIK